MAFIWNGDFLMADGGFAISNDCCCKFYTCYCYVRANNYGSQIVERRIVRYRAPEWDDAEQKWVFPDGQPCVPPGAQCTVTYTGVLVNNCGCAVGYGGSSVSWSRMDCLQPSACPTILPPP